MVSDTTARAILSGGDTATRDVLRFLLVEEGAVVTDAETLTAVALLVARTPGALVALLDPPDPLDRTVALLRQAGHRGVLLLLTHDVTAALRRRAFTLGVADVIGLPASPTEILARLRAAAGVGAERRVAAAHPIRAGGLTLHADRQLVHDETGWSIVLTPTEAALLGALMYEAGRPMPRHDLLDRVWGTRYVGDGGALDVYVRRLRRKLRAPHAPHGYVRTARGRGYVFDARGERRSEEPAPPHEAPAVLIVDDDAAIVALITAVLEDAGCRVVAAVGREAVIAARRMRPAVILLDLMMPDMDGIAVRQQLRAHAATASIPIIGLSAGRNLRARAAELEADDYLAKPFDIDELLLRVEKWARPGEKAPGP